MRFSPAHEIGYSYYSERRSKRKRVHPHYGQETPFVHNSCFCLRWIPIPSGHCILPHGSCTDMMFKSLWMPTCLSMDHTGCGRCQVLNWILLELIDLLLEIGQARYSCSSSHEIASLCGGIDREHLRNLAANVLHVGDSTYHKGTYNHYDCQCSHNSYLGYFNTGIFLERAWHLNTQYPSPRATNNHISVICIQLLW